jgi:glycosyltransferase involved in cell wall biosynthesis
MKILQVVTYISDDGAFGGPARVAQGQCEALAALGHDVILVAAAPIKRRQDSQVAGYRQILLPARTLSKRLGFAGMFARGLNKALASYQAADVAHVHLARDLVTLPAARFLTKNKIPTFLQTHGMIDESKRALAKPIDFFMTKPLIKRAKCVFTLTPQEDDDILQLVPSARIQRIANGIKIEQGATDVARDPNKVLFMARLHPRKRAVEFVQMANLVHSQKPETRFVIGGPDEGELAKVMDEIQKYDLNKVIQVLGPVKPNLTNELICSSSVYVLPSFGEIFPMTLLEAFKSQTPSVVTESLGVASDCFTYAAAKVTDGSPISLADAVLEILNDDATRKSLVAGANEFLTAKLDIREVANALIESYEPK